MVKTVKLDVLRTVASICKFGSLKFNMKIKQNNTQGVKMGCCSVVMLLPWCTASTTQLLGPFPFPSLPTVGLGREQQEQKQESSRAKLFRQLGSLVLVVSPPN